MKSLHLATRGPVLGLVLLSQSVVADVIVVAQDGSGDYVQINQAVVAASDGDTLLVRSGVYAPFIVPGKALQIVADEGESVTVQGYAAVTNLPAGKSALLSGLTAVAQMPVHRGLFLEDNAGSVRVLDCVFDGYSVPPVFCGDDEYDELDPGKDGAHVVHCSDVALVGCIVRGGTGGTAESLLCLNTGGAGGRGMHVDGSRVTLHDTRVIGGEGGTAGYGGDGGSGVDLVGTCELFAAKSDIRGGGAGTTNDVIDICGDGGTGLFAGVNSTVWLLDTEVSGGPHGDGPIFGCSSDGADFGGTGSVTQYPGTARSLASPRVARESTVAQLTVNGVPGDDVWLCLAELPGYRHDALLRGTLLLRPPMAMRFAGTVGGAGTLDVPLPLPAMPPALPARTLHLQTLIRSAADGQLLGGATQLVVVDSIY